MSSGRALLFLRTGDMKGRDGVPDPAYCPLLTSMPQPHPGGTPLPDRSPFPGLLWVEGGVPDVLQRMARWLIGQGRLTYPRSDWPGVRPCGRALIGQELGTGPWSDWPGAGPRPHRHCWIVSKMEPSALVSALSKFICILFKQTLLLLLFN